MGATPGCECPDSFPSFGYKGWMKDIALPKTSRLFRSTLIATGLFLTACGGSSDSATTPDADAAVASDAPTTAAPTTAATTTSESTTTTTAAPTTTTTAVAALSADDPVIINYCAATVEADNLAENTDYVDVQSFQNVIAGQLFIIEAITFPAPIETDLQVITSGLRDMATAVEAVESIDEIGPALDPIAESDEFQAAGDNIDAFEAEYCPDVSSSPSTTDNPNGITEADILALLETDAGRAGIAQGITTTTNLTVEEATCFIDNSEPANLVALFQLGTGETTEPTAEVQAGLVSALEACNLDVSAFGG